MSWRSSSSPVTAMQTGKAKVRSPAARPMVRGLIVLAAIIGMAVTALMGRWQLSRAAQKEALQNAITTQQSLPALDSQSLSAVKDPGKLMYREIELRGHWLPAHTVFLDNRQMNAKVGYYVLTPMQLEDASGVSGQVLLVQRGWVPRNFMHRTELPTIQTPTGTVRVQARIAPPPSKLLELGSTPPSSPDAEGVARIRQNIDLAEMAAQLHLPMLQAVSAMELGVASQGLLREWPMPSLGVEKHYGYAFQWFGMCALIFLLYVWFQMLRPFLHSRRPSAAPESAA